MNETRRQTGVSVCAAMALAMVTMLFVGVPGGSSVQAKATGARTASPEAADYGLVRLEAQASTSRLLLNTKAGEDETLKALAIKLVWKKAAGAYTPNRVALGWRGLPARVRQTKPWTVVTEGGVIRLTPSHVMIHRTPTTGEDRYDADVIFGARPGLKGAWGIRVVRAVGSKPRLRSISKLKRSPTATLRRNVEKAIPKRLERKEDRAFWQKAGGAKGFAMGHKSFGCFRARLPKGGNMVCTLFAPERMADAPDMDPYANTTGLTAILGLGGTVISSQLAPVRVGDGRHRVQAIGDLTGDGIDEIVVHTRHREGETTVLYMWHGGTWHALTLRVDAI